MRNSVFVSPALVWGFAGGLAIVAGCSGSDEPYANETKGGSEKVEICHVEGNGGFHTITVSAKAAPAHRAHGDTPGACNEVCAAVCDDGNECTIDDDGMGMCEQYGCPDPREPIICDDMVDCTDDPPCDTTNGCGASTPNDNNCDDGLDCTDNSCDAIDGCIFTSTCDDGLACTDDECGENGCSFTPNNDNCTQNACTTSVCDPDNAIDASGCVVTESVTECPAPDPCHYNEFAECDPESGCPTERLTSNGVCGTACDFQNGNIGDFQTECERICPDQNDFICANDPNGDVAACLDGDAAACEVVDATGSSFSCDVCVAPSPG